MFFQGAALLRSPYFNKGSAFTRDERREFKLGGLLPPNIQTLDEQVDRAYQQYRSRSNDLAKNTFMSSMKEQNVVLYYKLIQDHLKEMFSVIYTPTEGEAIENFSGLFRKPEGCFLNIEDQESIHDHLAQWGQSEDIDYIVVSDGEEILGIGDQGVGGILISVAKLVLMTLCGGIHPNRTLPVVLDCGTDNEKLLNDQLYLGLHRTRVRGKEYDAFVEAFVRSALELYPKAIIHFEDFGLQNARRILNKYQESIPCFNDDIQGTGCVTLAAIMAGLHITKLPLTDLRVVIFGSGSAGTGIADQIRDAIATKTDKSREEAAKQIWCLDKPGLLLKSHGDKLTLAQTPYAREDSEWKGQDTHHLLSIIQKVHPHVLIGTSTTPKAFTEEIIREMATHVDRPMIFPLSNPTRLHEADPQDIFTWTEGRALISTGSPFPPVEYQGRRYEVAECNNSACFPGIGLGAVLCRAKLLTDKMLVAAVEALASQSPALRDPEKGLVPDVEQVRDLSVHVAKAVIKQAIRDGLAQETDIPFKKVQESQEGKHGGNKDDIGHDDDHDDGILEEWIREQMWEPRYRPLQRVQTETASRQAKGLLGTASSHRPGRS
ncbi:MAG: hypothetical protein M1823_004214 [Watsoniomyces obsoletus]|nr:MAG: hypothetical protein M1823_004214 [Watsoniomyces obsoletus]